MMKILQINCNIHIDAFFINHFVDKKTKIVNINDYGNISLRSKLDNIRIALHFKKKKIIIFELHPRVR